MCAMSTMRSPLRSGNLCNLAKSIALDSRCPAMMRFGLRRLAVGYVVVIDGFGVSAHPVVYEVKPGARQIHWASVRWPPWLRSIPKPDHPVLGPRKHRLIRLGTRMGLHIHMIRANSALARSRQVFHNIDVLTAAIVCLPG